MTAMKASSMKAMGDLTQLVTGLLAVGCWVFLVFELPDALPAGSRGSARMVQARSTQAPCNPDLASDHDTATERPRAAVEPCPLRVPPRAVPITDVTATR